MSDSNQNEILSEFRAVTNVAEDRAKFYLESANWNLQVRTIYTYMNCQRKCKSVHNTIVNSVSH